MRLYAIAVMVGVVGLSALASLGYGPTLFGFVKDIPGEDRTGHFAVFGLLSLTANLGFSTAQIRGRALGVIGCTLLVLLATTAEETLQLTLPSRAFDLKDLAFSYAGVLTSAVIAWLVLRKRADRAN